MNPNYRGGGRSEYFSSGEYGSKLDCHSPSSEWILLGVYRQEFYQYIEQISKHLWAIKEYQYVVAVAGQYYTTSYPLLLLPFSLLLYLRNFHIYLFDFRLGLHVKV